MVRGGGLRRKWGRDTNEEAHGRIRGGIRGGEERGKNQRGREVRLKGGIGRVR